PTAARQLTALTLVGVGVLVRPQAAMLAPALLSAILLAAVGEAVAERRRVRLQDVRRTLSPYTPTFFSLGAVVAIAAAWEWSRGRSIFEIFGTAAGVWHMHASLGQVAKWSAYHVAELDLYAGVL